MILKWGRFLFKKGTVPILKEIKYIPQQPSKHSHKKTFFSEEKGSIVASIKGLSSFCKPDTVSKTLVGAILSALFAIIIKGLPERII